MDANQKLKQSFNFTDEDLRENRTGRLSAAQMARLRGNANRNFLIFVAMLLGIGILTLTSISSTSNEMLMMFLCLSLPAAIAFTMTLGAAGRAADPQAVQKRSGQAYISTPPVGYNPPLPMERLPLVTIRRGFFDTVSMYNMVVDDMMFNLTMEEHEALTSAYYTVYFLPHMRNKIVALEIVALTDERTRRIGDIPEPSASGVPAISAGQPAVLYEPDSEDLKG